MNLSDTEIIKALECCSKAKTNEECKKLGCPFFDEDIDMCGTINSETIIQSSALALINRLQADKEALIAGQETLQKCIAEKMAEIERYKGVIKILEKDISVARAEGVKEFAHLIIDKSKNGRIYANDIPDYAKEMAGDSE